MHDADKSVKNAPFFAKFRSRQNELSAKTCSPQALDFAGRLDIFRYLPLYLGILPDMLHTITD